MLNLGFFAEFKGADSVLLQGAPQEVEDLVKRLARFASSSDAFLPIHAIAVVPKRHPAKLFASRSKQILDEGFAWLRSL